MKIKELIEALQGKDPEAVVVIHGYEGGFHEVARTLNGGIFVDLHRGDAYYGEHEFCSEEYAEGANSKAVLLLHDCPKDEDDYTGNS